MALAMPTPEEDAAGAAATTAVVPAVAAAVPAMVVPAMRVPAATVPVMAVDVVVAAAAGILKVDNELLCTPPTPSTPLTLVLIRSPLALSAVLLRRDDEPRGARGARSGASGAKGAGARGASGARGLGLVVCSPRNVVAPAAPPLVERFRLFRLNVVLLADDESVLWLGVLT